MLSRTMKRYEKDFYSDLRKFVLIHADFENARGWQLSDLAKHPLVNDTFGKKPVLVVFDKNSTSARIYARSLSGTKPLTFESIGERRIKDDETNSVWDLDTAKAISGPLKGKSLKPLVGTMARKDAWEEFYPNGSLWKPH